jgi:hypothetical protein
MTAPGRSSENSNFTLAAQGSSKDDSTATLARVGIGDHGGITSSQQPNACEVAPPTT